MCIVRALVIVVGDIDNAKPADIVEKSVAWITGFTSTCLEMPWWLSSLSVTRVQKFGFEKLYFGISDTSEYIITIIDTREIKSDS